MSGDVDYQDIFRQSKSLYMLLDINKYILDASDDYLIATLTQRNNMVGRYLFDVFPDDPNQPEATGVRNLTRSIDIVLQTKEVHVMELQKYDVPKGDGTFELRYWLPRNIPILDSDGNVACILHQAENVTEHILLQEKERLSTTKLGSAEIEIRRQIQEIAKINQELIKSRDEALEASRMKSALLANVSHELRTPLSSILGYSELAEKLPINQEVKQSIDVIHTSAETLLSIVNDLLDVSQMEKLKLRLTEAPIYVRALIDELMATLRPSAEFKGITMTSVVSKEVPEVIMGDPRRIRQVIHTFLTNGIKFTEKGDVKLQMRVLDKFLHVEISDTGIGMTDEQQEKLFAAFYQVDISNTREYGGLGLGLTIAKHLVEMMGGHVGVRSKLKEGSTFWFQIPIKSASATNVISANSCEECRILIVEDNLVIQRLLKKQLTTLGVKCVDFANNGQEGVDKTLKNIYDIIFMDIQMPVMDGYAATRAIRATEHHHHVIIAMTASIMQEDQARALKAGMDAILGKPFTLKELKETIDRWY